jgi:ribosomal protein L32
MSVVVDGGRLKERGESRCGEFMLCPSENRKLANRVCVTCKYFSGTKARKGRVCFVCTFTRQLLEEHATLKIVLQKWQLLWMSV